MLKNRIFYLFFLCLLGILYVFSDGYFMLVSLLALIAAPILSLIVFLGSLSVLDLKVGSSDGNEQGIVYYVNNYSRFFPGILIWESEIKHSLSGERFSCHLRRAVWAEEKGRLELTLGNARTGKLEVHTKKLKVVDFLGLFHKSLISPPSHGILIYPSLFGVEFAVDNSIEVYGDSLKYSQCREGNDVNEIFALHEYTEGDDLRRVHWKLSSKTETLMVRDFGQPLNCPVLLLLDLVRDDKTGADSFSACIDAFVSLSVALLAKGIGHNIAWFNSLQDCLSVEEVLSMENLQLRLPDILSVAACGKELTALRCYCLTQNVNSSQILYYVSSFYQPELQAEISSWKKYNVFLVGGDASLPALGGEGCFCGIPVPVRDDFLLRLVG